MNKAKQLWVLAGGNGAGKTTFFNTFLKPHNLSFVNADIIAKMISPGNEEKSSYEAALLAEKAREELLEKGFSFCYETVFSHPSKINFIARAKALGYEVFLIYIHLFSIELNEARVHQRISEGGHGVPVEKIHARVPRTMDNIQQTLPMADQAKIYDNSFFNTPFKLIASIKKAKCMYKTDPLPDWAKYVLKGILTLPSSTNYRKDFPPLCQR